MKKYILILSIFLVPHSLMSEVIENRLSKIVNPITYEGIDVLGDGGTYMFLIKDKKQKEFILIAEYHPKYKDHFILRLNSDKKELNQEEMKVAKKIISKLLIDKKVHIDEFDAPTMKKYIKLINKKQNKGSQ